MMGNVFCRRPGYEHPVIVRGEGVYLWDEAGRRYLDAAGGAAVVNIGHGVAEVVQAMAAQAAAAQGAYLGQCLGQALGDLPCVGDVRGIGMLWGVELVADRHSRAPFDPAAGLARRVGDLALDRGLVLYPGHDGADGAAGDHVLLAPPLTIAPPEIDQVVETLRYVLESCSRP